MSTARTADVDADQAGFGMIEIVVSMFLIAILAMAFLPMIVQGLQVARGNTTIATATQLLSQQLEIARNLDSTCAAMIAFDDAAVAPVIDSRGVSLQPQRAVGPCPTAGPGTVPVRAWVTETGSTAVIAEATTLILVGGAP
jgi:prepilin-type N-terminal cleavage/methylation domain-containing protein